MEYKFNPMHNFQHDEGGAFDEMEAMLLLLVEKFSIF